MVERYGNVVWTVLECRLNRIYRGSLSAPLFLCSNGRFWANFRGGRTGGRTKWTDKFWKVDGQVLVVWGANSWGWQNMVAQKWNVKIGGSMWSKIPRLFQHSRLKPSEIKGFEMGNNQKGEGRPGLGEPRGWGRGNGWVSSSISGRVCHQWSRWKILSVLQDWRGGGLHLWNVCCGKDLVVPTFFFKLLYSSLELSNFLV